MNCIFLAGNSVLYHVSYCTSIDICKEGIKLDGGWKNFPKFLYKYDVKSNIIINKNALMDYYSTRYNVKQIVYTKEEMLTMMINLYNFPNNVNI